MNFSSSKTLIAVCNDELLLNLIKKIVMTNDDISTDNIIGVKDGTVKVVAWDEKMWLDNKKAGTIDSNIVLIGDVKKTENLYPLIDIKFSKLGVEYGWSEKQAIITANPKKVKRKAERELFIQEIKNTFEKFEKTSLPEIFKNTQDGTKNALKSFGVGALASLFVPLVGAPLTLVAGIGKAIKTKKDGVITEQQMLVYGILNFYMNDLAEFMNQ